ncbi:hypothetical protein SESBI_33891 [Sesbania bispinosa]|nr:hypothetical protein SESBI_33891 [Sesbania bispinosa]
MGMVKCDQWVNNSELIADIGATDLICINSENHGDIALKENNDSLFQSQIVRDSSESSPHVKEYIDLAQDRNTGGVIDKSIGPFKELNPVGTRSDIQATGLALAHEKSVNPVGLSNDDAVACSMYLDAAGSVTWKQHSGRDSIGPGKFFFWSIGPRKIKSGCEMTLSVGRQSRSLDADLYGPRDMRSGRELGLSLGCEYGDVNRELIGPGELRDSRLDVTQVAHQALHPMKNVAGLVSTPMRGEEVAGGREREYGAAE